MFILFCENVFMFCLKMKRQSARKYVQTVPIINANNWNLSAYTSKNMYSKLKQQNAGLRSSFVRRY